MHNLSHLVLSWHHCVWLYILSWHHCIWLYIHSLWHHYIWLYILSLLASLYMAIHTLSPGITVYGYTYTLSWHHCIWLYIHSLLASLYMAIHTLSLGITVYGYAYALYWPLTKFIKLSEYYCSTFFPPPDTCPYLSSTSTKTYPSILGAILACHYECD